MSTQTDKLITLIKPYGLTEDESRVYLEILENGVQTALQLSRRLRLSRTTVYRIVDKLIEKQLVVQQLDSRGLKFTASDPQKIEQLLGTQQATLDHLRQALPEVLTRLHALTGHNQTNSKILYYSGKSGLEQVSYNLLKAKEMLRVYEVEHLSEFTDPEFAEHIRQEMVAQNIFNRDLTNKPAFGNYTQVTELVTRLSEFRYLDPSLLKIDFEVMIYNDVYVMSTYKDADVFCVEVYNPQLASMQKQLYDFIWNHAQPMTYSSPYGAARVKN